MVRIEKILWGESWLERRLRTADDKLELGRLSKRIQSDVIVDLHLSLVTQLSHDHVAVGLWSSVELSERPLGELPLNLRRVSGCEDFT